MNDTTAPVRREGVMFEDYEVVAAKLRANPGQNYLVAGRPLHQRAVLQSTAHRINRGRLAAFQPDPTGYFVASVHKATDPGAAYPIEMDMSWQLTRPAGERADN